MAFPANLGVRILHRVIHAATPVPYEHPLIPGDFSDKGDITSDGNPVEAANKNEESNSIEGTSLLDTGKFD